MVRLEVPERAVVGRSYPLKCIFDLGGRELNSVKWYKNDSEFYRYEPRSKKPIQTFPAPGILINSNITDNGTTLYLEKVTLETSGKYKCEVTTETDFNTAHLEKEMIVSMTAISSSPQPTNKHWIIFLTLLSLVSV